MSSLLKKFSETLAALMVVIMVFSILVYASPANLTPRVITDYIEYINSEKYEKIPDLMYYTDRIDYQSFIADTTNRDNHVGIFNKKSLQLISSHQNDSVCIEMLNYPEEIISEFVSIENWSCSVFVEVYNETGNLHTGENKYNIYVGKHKDGNEYILSIERNGIAENNNDDGLYFPNASPEKPLSTRGHFFENPKAIRVAIYKESENAKTITCDFREYCYNVTFCEFGSKGYHLEAIKSVAVAVRQYAYYRINNPKYEDVDYDVKSTNADQIYNEDKDHNDNPNVKRAVDETWNNLILSSDYGIIMPSYSAGTKNSPGVQYCGRLSQNGANYLAKKGYTFDRILKYYFDHVQGVEYRNGSNVPYGEVTVPNVDHEPVLNTSFVIRDNMFYHSARCEKCGIVAFQSHTWIGPSADAYYRCKVCGLRMKNPPVVLERYAVRF